MTIDDRAKAVEVIKCMTSADSAATWSKQVNYVPANQQAAATHVLENVAVLLDDHRQLLMQMAGDLLHAIDLLAAATANFTGLVRAWKWIASVSGSAPPASSSS